MSKNIWEIWRDKELVRGGGVLEPDVNYFIQKLESLGVKTLFSCAGHPYGFYIVFKSTYNMARRILGCGFFEVELERCGGGSCFSIRIADRCLHDIVDGPGDSFSIAKETSGAHAAANKRKILSYASEAWEQKL